jgi:uncharacterized protein (DUF362 family)
VSRSISRRTFLLGSATAVAGAAAVASTAGWLRREPEPWDHSAFPPPGDARVAVLRASGYDRGLEEVVADGLRAISADVSGASVVLKPNLVEVRKDLPINTDPRLVSAAVLALRRLGAASVTVAEGPGHRRDTTYVRSASGLDDALHAVEAPFVDLNTDSLVRRPLRSSFTSLGSLWVPQTIAEADVVVSMPKMKTHHWAGATLSMKNCFGCVPGRVYGWPKNVLHFAGIGQAIIDVTAAVRPRYAIVDGIVGMQGNGPITGTPAGAGVLVFGDDPVATDVIAATLMGIDPTRLDYLREASRFLGQGDRERIRTEGEDVDRAVVPFQLIPEFASLRA